MSIQCTANTANKLASKGLQLDQPGKSTGSRTLKPSLSVVHDHALSFFLAQALPLCGIWPRCWPIQDQGKTLLLPKFTVLGIGLTG